MTYYLTQLALMMKHWLQKHFLFVSIALFQATWLACVVGQGWWMWLGLALTLLHLLLSPNLRTDAQRAPVVALVGIAADYALMHFGVFEFPASMFPLWLAILWAAFGISFYHSFAWLLNKPLALQALVGVVGGPLSYAAGMQLGAVSFPQPLALTLALLAVFWGVFIVVLCRVHIIR